MRAWVNARRNEVLHGLNIPVAVYHTEVRGGEFLRFLAHLPHPTRQVLIDAVRRSDGLTTGYRLLGEPNQRWIKSATESGFDMNVWLDPNPRRLKLESDALPTKLTISLTSLPGQVLWMGRPFDSCLDLRGGDFCESVVPNFMDANKQLLVVLDRSGQMVGRKLLSVVPGNGLVGYYLYLATSKKHQNVYAEVNRQVTAYCRDLAVRAGLTLQANGTPKKLNSNGWYDDGTVEWAD